MVDNLTSTPNISNSPLPMMNGTTSSAASDCDLSMESLQKNIWLYCVQMLILGSSLLSILALLHSYFRNRFAVHGNLLVLFASIIVVTFFNNLGFFAGISRNVFLYFFMQNPCDLLTPLWLCVVFLSPTMVYTVAYPLFHFGVTVERVRATLLARHYEAEGQRLGIWMVSVIWLVSIALVSALVWMTYLDPDMTSHAQPFIILSSTYNKSLIFAINIFMLVLVIFTALCDWRITVANNRIRAAMNSKNSSLHYSLSMNYQLHENALAMRLILPLDVTYALLYSFYQMLVILIRAHGQALAKTDYIFYYNLANTLLYLYSAVIIIVYIRFVHFVSRSRRQNPEAKPVPEHGKIYFKQLEMQWQ